MERETWNTTWIVGYTFTPLPGQFLQQIPVTLHLSSFYIVEKWWGLEVGFDAQKYKWKSKHTVYKSFLLLQMHARHWVCIWSTWCVIKWCRGSRRDVMSWSVNMFRVTVSQSVSGCLTSLRTEEWNTDTFTLSVRSQMLFQYNNATHCLTTEVQYIAGEID